ncbi:MAG: hypothetical protein LUQ69_06715 [Methanoregulaceae archaeon]|nr:hypothetical protein [Methanoregulaceae archaeon]
MNERGQSCCRIHLLAGAAYTGKTVKGGINECTRLDRVFLAIPFTGPW